LKECRVSDLKPFAEISKYLAGEIEKDEERTQDSQPLSRGLKAEPPEGR
jgi:hypothetical protein